MKNNTRIIKCAKLNREAPGLTFVPYPGVLGEKIYYHVSEAAWNQWIDYMTILINENRLEINHPEVRKILEDEMEHFFFSSEEN